MSQADPLSSLVSSLKNQNIISDVVPESFYPTQLLTLKWPNGKEIVLGDTLAVEDTVDEPSIQIAPMTIPTATAAADSSGEPEDGGEPTYTIVLTDPDAPSRAEPIYREFRHWVLTGLKSHAQGGIGLTALSSKTATTPYRPPGPRTGSGVHRYVFLLFQEPASGSPQIPVGAPEYGSALEERRSWSAMEFGNKYGLKLVGVNFFLVHAQSAA